MFCGRVPTFSTYFWLIPLCKTLTSAKHGGTSLGKFEGSKFIFFCERRRKNLLAAPKDSSHYFLIPCPPPFLCKKGATTSSFGKYFPRKCVFSREKLFEVMLGKISYYAVFVQALPSALLLLLLWYR